MRKRVPLCSAHIRLCEIACFENTSVLLVPIGKPKNHNQNFKLKFAMQAFFKPF